MIEKLNKLSNAILTLMKIKSMDTLGTYFQTPYLSPLFADSKDSVI